MDVPFLAKRKVPYYIGLYFVKGIAQNKIYERLRYHAIFVESILSTFADRFAAAS